MRRLPFTCDLENVFAFCTRSLTRKERSCPEGPVQGAPLLQDRGLRR